MDDNETTAAIQRYLDALADARGDSSAEPIISTLIERSVRRLQLLCATQLYRNYPRLTRSPAGIDADEVLSAVVERLIKALRATRPTTVRQFFSLANRHMRWELNDLARRLDRRVSAVKLDGIAVPAPESSGSRLSPNTVRILEAIETLSDDLREVFDLVRIQGMTHEEVAGLLEVSSKTVQRRLNLGVLALSDKLADLRPAAMPPGDDPGD